MLSDVLSTFKNKNILKLTGLDEKCQKILMFLLFSDQSEFGHNELRRAVDSFGFPIPEPTFTAHLNHLEEKKIISRIQSENKTIIKLQIVDLHEKLALNTAFNGLSRKFDELKLKNRKMSVREIYENLRWLYIDKAYMSLAFELMFLNNQMDKGLLNATLSVIETFYGMLADTYFEILGERSLIEKNEILHLHLSQK